MREGERERERRGQPKRTDGRGNTEHEWLSAMDGARVVWKGERDGEEGRRKSGGWS